MNQTRTYGVEFEIKGNRAQVAAAIQLAGIDLNNSFSYHHNLEGGNSRWELKSDATVQGGMEIVSPKLVGDEGLEEIKIVLDAINSTGAFVDTDCGTHIHLGMNQEIEAGEKVARKVARNVEMISTRWAHSINQLVSKSRRSQRWCATKTSSIRVDGGDCQSWTARSIASQLDSIRQEFKTTRSMERSPAFHTRYRSVNMTNLVKAIQVYRRTGSLQNTLPTIEIRIHQGTTDATKIINWIKLWQAIFETATTARPMTANVIWKDRGTNELSFFLWTVLKTLPATEKKELTKFFKARAKTLNGRTVNARGEDRNVRLANISWRQNILSENPTMTAGSQTRLVNIAVA